MAPKGTDTREKLREGSLWPQTDGEMHAYEQGFLVGYMYAEQADEELEYDGTAEEAHFFRRGYERGYMQGLEDEGEEDAETLLEDMDDTELEEIGL